MNGNKSPIKKEKAKNKLDVLEAQANEIIKSSDKKEKAKNKLEALKDQANEIIKKLKMIKDLFIKMESPGEKEKSKKRRTMVEKVQNRIEFKFNGLNFYIDFTLVSHGDDLHDIKGSIIYGVNRTLCFADCIHKETIKKIKNKICDIIARCDQFEDKPLVQFSVDRHGLIKSNGGLKDEWWVKNLGLESKKGLEDLHYRTLCEIWNEALDWTNETILP